MKLANYQLVLRTPYIARLLAGVLLNGVWAAVPLAIILAVRDAHSFSAAGIAAAAFAICAGLSNPVRGRMVDRFGPTRALLALAIWRAVCLTLVAAATKAQASALVLCAVAALAGTGNPPVASVMRAMWRSLVEGERLHTGYALQSMLNEVGYVLWPVIVGVSAATAGPAWTLVLVAAIELSGTLVFVSVPKVRSWREPKHESGPLGALGAPRFRALVAINLPLGMAFGAFDLAAPALAIDEGANWAAGVAMATLAVGSMLGGLLYGARRWRLPTRYRFLALLVALSLGFIPIAFASSVPALIALSAIAGLAVAPTLATIFSLVDDVAPAGTGTEAMTWILAVYALGTALGAALAGFLVADHLHAALAAPALCAASAAALAAFRVQRLCDTSPIAAPGSPRTASSTAE